MGFTLGRLVRILASISIPTSAVLAFATLLTWIFILYQPTPGPGEIQRLGWQAWDLISPIPAPQAVESDTEASDPELDDGVDWWNVTSQSSQQKQDPSTFPLDVWSPLLPHVSGLTEITIAKCLYPSSLGNLCYPKSSSEQDAIKGKWVKVERDLNAMSGLWSLYIYYRRSRRLDVDLIQDILLLPNGEEPSSPGNWHKVSTSIRDGVPRVPALYLWYNLGKTSTNLSDDEKSTLITEIDVLFGEDRPWYGFERLQPATTFAQEGRMDSAWVTIRRGVKPVPRAPPLHFSHSGKFKIMQIADLHFSVSQGECRDVSFSPCTHSDNLTQSLIERVLDAEKPDMVVFSGDQLNGQGTSWDPRSVLAKFATSVTDRGIPWAAIFGNHDSENGLSREDQMALMQGMPFSLVKPGPKDIHGVGNYVLKVLSPDPSKTHILTLYLLDSGDYSKGVFDWFGFWHPTEYDWLRQDQIDWFLQESASIPHIERPFTPDGAADFGSVWKRQSSDQIRPQSKKLAKPNALMFFHIPLPESFDIPPDLDPNTDVPLDVGLQEDERGDAKHSDGFFDKGVANSLESDRASGSKMKEVKVISNGHNHVSQNCRRIKGVWLCFGGGGSYSGYGKIGFDRRFRFFDISDFGETIRTYKRTEKDDIVDDMVLVGKGAPAYYG